MKKKYTIHPNLLLILLITLSINLTATAQSKVRGNAARTSTYTAGSTENTSRSRIAAPTPQATDVITACGSYMWPINGVTYTISGIYNFGGGITQIFNDQTDWDNSATATGATVASNDMSGIPAALTVDLVIGTTNVNLSSSNGIYSNGVFVGASDANESLTLTFNPPIYGISGNYFTTDIADAVISGNVTATYSDGAVDSRTVTTDTESFGYFSTTPITSLVLTTTTTVPNHFISLNNLSIATNPASSDVLDLTIIPVVTPTFPVVAPICSGSALSPLPTTSDNGIPGSWSPALDNTNTTTYTFTPDPGECADVVTTTITVFPLGANTTAVTACNSYTWPVTGTNYTTSGSYTTTIPLTDTAVIDDFSLWTDHAFSFNSTIEFTDLSGFVATNPTLVAFATSTVTISSPGGMYSSGDFLGTANPNSTMTLSFNPPVYGVSANYFTTDINDNVISGNVTVTYSNGHVESRTVSTDTDTFGYFDNNFISSIVLSSNTSVPNRYLAIKNLAIATNPTSCSTETLDLTINTTPPPGDTMATAIDVNTINYTTTGNNLASNCFTDTIGTSSPDVWYKVTLDDCAQLLSLDTCTGSDFDTIITVFAQDGITELANSDDDCGSTFQSSISDLDVSAEDVVYIVVEGYVGLGSEQGTYGLNVSQTLTSPITPTFTAIADICNGDTLTALPTTSDNGITGSWSPALDNTTTTTYTFTPDLGQCGLTASLTIIVNQPTDPTFTAVADICSGDSLSPLPTTSDNGITGSWSPALDNTATTTYTFTPDSGQCASTASLTITVNQPTDPTFTAAADICSGDSLSPLPTTSNDGITGSWSPALDNTTTTTYTFSPDSGQCALTTTLTITVNQPTVPTFTAVADICSGDSLSPLPTTSNDGITGSWSPALDNTTTTTYTFTPDSGQCASTALLTITVNQPIIPTFTAVAAICLGDVLSPLPLLSNNGITGTWSPALDVTTTTTYTFTPDSGQCAASTTLVINVNLPITIPTFTAIGPICNGDSLVLPTISTNGIVGSWSPAVDNTSTTIYLFTPDPGQCGLPTLLTVIVNQPVSPTFNAVAAICNGDSLVLPTTSINGISGAWSPTIDNTTTTTYTFTPDGGQCGLATTLTVTVNQPTTPVFNAVADICSGDALTALSTSSNNGISGTWSPALDNTATTTYTFTPDAGQCAAMASLTITVNQPTTPTFSAIADICNGDPLLALPTTSNNSVTGTWSPALDNTTTTTYTFTPDTGQCAATTTMTITVHTTVTPTGNAFQIFDVADLNDATIAGLVVNPVNVNWYASLADALSLDNPLPLSTVLTNGAVYYAVAFSATCPSEPFAVTVTVNLGNNEWDNLHFSYYPNPTSSAVTISYSKNITKVTLVNMIGQVLSTENTDATEVQIDLSRLAEATYFIRVVSDEQEKVIKVIKQR